MRVTGDLRARIVAQLADEESQKIIATVLDKPKTTREIAGDVTLPSTTLYRKISELRDCGLIIIDSFDFRSDGKREARYTCGFKEIIFKSNSGVLELDIVPSSKGLEKKWFEMFYSTTNGRSPEKS